MDVATYLRCFENSLSTFTSEDPLDPWDKFVEYLEQTLPADGASGMSLVLDRIVQKFLNDQRYANDIRFVNHCIKCASFYSDPTALYSHVFEQGVGTTTAALYVAWAQQFELKGLNEQADAVYQRALENQAQPAETILNEQRSFQTRTKSQAAASRGRSPLQNSHLSNQMSSHTEPEAQSKLPVECPPVQPERKYVITVSRSETSAYLASREAPSVPTVSAYNKEELVCEGSELCFEEVRAERYFRRLRDKKETESQEKPEELLKQAEEGMLSLKSYLEKIRQEYETPNPTQQPFGAPQPSRSSLGLRLHTEPTFFTPEAFTVQEPPQQHSSRAVDTLTSEVSHHPSVLAERSVHLPQPEAASAPVVQRSMAQQYVDDELHRSAAVAAGGAGVFCQDDGVQPLGEEEHHRPQELNTTHQLPVLRDAVDHPEPEERLNMSQGGTANLSHITPNTSLGFVPATPSRVLPSPTVNTREALDVIMDMFQAPTLLEDPFSTNSVLHAAEHKFDDSYARNAGSASSSSKPSASAPFTIFQDDNDKENGSAAAPSAAEKFKAAGALAEIPMSSKPNETAPDLMPDESTMWGARYNSLHSLAACPNSTSDFAMLAQCVSTPFTHKMAFNFYEGDEENTCDGGDNDGDFIRRQLKKLSPILEQSPCEDTALGPAARSSAALGTIVGEGLAAPTQHCMTSSSITAVQSSPPPAILSFRDQTLCPTNSSAPGTTTGPGWEVYPDPDETDGPRREAFTIMEDLDKPASPPRLHKPLCDVPMSPDCALNPDWLNIRSLNLRAGTDLDAFLSPRPLSKDVPMSPQRPPQLCADVPMSPMQVYTEDEPMMSPDRRPSAAADVSMNTASAAVQLVSDPWDDQLIRDLLSSLSPPLTSHPRCFTWQCRVPSITPKTTISMGKSSLRVDCVVGEGAFAKVFQATDPMTTERSVLKVQTPANPWEFYINTRLDARLRPDVRHLYSRIHSAHLFHNGSVLLGELHSHGTLLNAVNLYKTMSDKVMPQPLVMYFTVCILHMVEQLHAVNIVHADVKPDNFLLGDRFLDNRCFEPENLDHGLVLVDFGQSIDMELFPEGTAFTAKCLTSGFQCTEMLSGKPWNYQTDYFGIAGTVYCMLFGTYMRVTNEGGVWKTNAVFRRNPHSDLWLDLFHTLLNVPDCRSLPSLRSLCCKMASALQQNYSSKLPTLKSRLMVLLLESSKAARR